MGNVCYERPDHYFDEATVFRCLQKELKLQNTNQEIKQRIQYLRSATCHSLGEEAVEADEVIVMEKGKKGI